MPSVEVAASAARPRPGHRTHDQVNAVRDFVDDFPEAVALIGEEQREMRGDVAERPDAQHPSHIDQIAGAQNVPKRRHCERHAEKNQRPESGAMNQFIERPRTMRNVIRLKDGFGEWHQQHCKRTEAQPRHTAATIAPQLPGMRDRPRARLNHRARPSSQDIAFRLLSAFATISSITDAWLQCRNAQFTRIKGALVLEFSSCLDSSQSKKARK
jgi:hypothetical protein